MVSATFDTTYRPAVRNAIGQLGHVPLGMEYFGAVARPSRDVVERTIARSDALVLVLGERFGTVIPGLGAEESYVRFELRRARERALPWIGFVMDEVTREACRRASLASATPAEADQLLIDFARQDEFIAEVMTLQNVAMFSTPESLATAIAVALPVLARQLEADPRRGLVPRTLLASSEDRIAGLTTLSRLATITNLPEDTHMTDIPDLFTSTLPIADRIAAALARDLLDRLPLLREAGGFATAGAPELQRILAACFAARPISVRATSVDSAYWHRGHLDMNRHNIAHLERGGAVERLWCIGDLVDLPLAGWLGPMLDQVECGEVAKVLECGGNDGPEDFGIYEFENGDAVLLRGAIDGVGDMHTTATTHPMEIARHATAFASMFEASGDAVVVHRRRDDPRPPSTTVTEGAVSAVDLVGPNFYLRRLEAVYGDDAQTGFSEGVFGRKFEMPYAQVVSRLLQTHSDLLYRDDLLMVGDTSRNDGGCMLNLMRLGHSLRGFVRDRFRVGCFTAVGITYSDDWRDLEYLAAELAARPDLTNVALLLDIDQTFWAPKGVDEIPLGRARVGALHRTVATYRGADDPTYRARASALYEYVCTPEMAGLVQDDECKKMVICAFLAMGAFAPDHVLTASPKRGGKYFQAVARQGLREFMADARAQLAAFDPDRGLLPLMVRCVNVIESEPYATWAAGSEPWVNWKTMLGDAKDVQERLSTDAPVAFKRFREAELTAMLEITGVDVPLRDRLVANRPVVEFVRWVQERGAIVIGLSDRPEEATFRTGASLLETPLTITGPHLDLPEGTAA